MILDMDDMFRPVSTPAISSQEITVVFIKPGTIQYKPVTECFDYIGKTTEVKVLN